MELRDVRKNYGKTVTYRGIRYRLDKCIEAPAYDGYAYTAELHDLKACSVTIAKLEDVEIERCEIKNA